MDVKHAVGPELFWLLLYALAVILGKANAPGAKWAEDLIQSSWFWIPAASVLVFGLWWMPSTEKGPLLFLRVWIVGLVGSYFVAEKAISASAYQNSGSGMGVLAAVCIELFFLFVGSVVVGIKLLWFK